MKTLIRFFAITLVVWFASTLSAQPYEGRKGDVNDDGSINVLDMLTIANHILGANFLDAGGIWRADLNGPVGNFDGDGSVNVLDMVKIANIILGIDECPPMPCTAVTDIDGNVYQTVQIGDQCWMAENLKVTHYRNGDAIPDVPDNSDWGDLLPGAYCNYNNDVNNVATYGRLYNWFAVSDSQDIAPEGWHVPSDAEWQTLVDYLGGYTVAGGKMKTTGTIETGTGLWSSPNYGATNESGFSALPAGFRHISGSFNDQGNNIYFWSATENSYHEAWCQGLNYGYAQVNRGHLNKEDGFSLRCVRD